ncbi:MAG: uroporphyrinogen-III C-methyltransferase [Anaerofustis sp.]
MKKGKVWLVGAGPSDVGLLTIKAKETIEQADVVVYDSLVGDAILGLIPRSAKLIYVGKRAGNAAMSQENINKVLLAEALNGNKVVRLKGGDPFLFGRGGEELELLTDNEVPFEIIPGVTSAVSVPAYAGIPVTHRDYCSSVHIITGHRKHVDKPEIDFPSLVKLDGTLVFLMGVGSLSYICDSLIKAGMSEDMPAAILEQGTTAAQRRVVSTVIRLPQDAEAADIKTPAIIVVGNVCSLADHFHWAEDRPLGGVRIIVTRPQELASTLSKRLRENGAEVIELPSIETIEIEDNAEIISMINNLNQYHWIVFTSPTGVNIFFRKLVYHKIDLRTLAGIKFAAIGSATAKAINDKGLTVDCIPKQYHSTSLGQALADTVKDREKVLIPRARIGSKELTDALDDNDIEYDDVPIYDTVYVRHPVLEARELIDGNKTDYVAFTSASSVKGFVNAVGAEDLSHLHAVCIGEHTAVEARKYGMKIDLSDTITINGIIDKITQLQKEKTAGKKE